MGNQGLIRQHETKLDFVARAIDAAWIAFALYIAVYFYPQSWDSTHSVASLSAILLFFLSGQASGLYRSNRGTPLQIQLTRIWSSWGIVVAILLLLAFATKTSEYFSRIISFSWFILAPTLISCWRFLLGVALQELRSRGYNTRSVAIVGMSEFGLKIAKTIRIASWLGLRFVGFYDDRSNLMRFSDVDDKLAKIAGNLENLLEEARKGEIDLIYIALPPRAEPRINNLIQRLGDTTASVYMAYDFGGFELLRAQWTTLGDIPALSLVENPFNGIDGWVKRLEDIVLSILILIIIAVPMMIIAIAVKLTSRGPIFFHQRRYGLNGEVIDVLKFRSMKVCENDGQVKQATKNDVRITPLGGLLRRTSLDELPQFINVLTGQMSIVGPRPHAVAHNEQYRALIQDYMRRHKVKPGITGWAQVNGWRGETDTLEKMEMRVMYDLDYIRNWGLLLDLKIILLTIFGSKVKNNAF